MPPELTYGQKAVGLKFNPSGDDRVGTVKQQFADIIDGLNAIRIASGPGEKGRLASIAITEAQAAQMWAVKAITWEEGNPVTGVTSPVAGATAPNAG